MRLLDERLGGDPVDVRMEAVIATSRPNPPAAVLPTETDAVTVEPVMSAISLRATTPGAPWKQAL